MIDKLKKELELNKDRYKLPANEFFSNPIEKAAFLGFGEGSSVYDTCVVMGKVIVGKNVKIGPYTLLDGTGGGLTIGDGCEIAAGVQIYTHDTMRQALSNGKEFIARSATTIGNHCYIGPNSVIAKGVNLGDHTLVESGSLVSTSFSSNSIVGGAPAKKLGVVKLGETVELIYDA